jgi:hypothetical protein
MVAIEWVFNQYFLIAQVLNLASYSQSNFLILRLIFIGSSLFFCIFTITSHPLTIDILLFNLTFFIINIWRSIPLLKELVPPNLMPELEDMYNKYFYKFMRKQEFKILFASASRQVFKISCSIVKPGNGFSSLFFLPLIPENCKAIITQHGSDYLINSYCWIGILEFLELLSTSDKKLTKHTIKNNNCFWRLKLRLEINRTITPADAFKLVEDDKENFKENKNDFFEDDKVEINNYLALMTKKSNTSNLSRRIAKVYDGQKNEKSDEEDNKDFDELSKILFKEKWEIKQYVTNRESFNKMNIKQKNNFLLETVDLNKEEQDYLVVYEFDLLKLVEIFNLPSNGSSIMKALYSMWLELCSDIVKKKNEKSHVDVKSRRDSKLKNVLNKLN